jgi:hypothetical protein
LKELVNLGLKEECNIDEIGSKFIQKSCWTFLLEAFQLVEAISQRIGFLFTGITLLTHFVPDRIDIGDLICQEKLVS